MSRVRVAYVAGTGRSGSTLLDCMLGELPGAFSSGEVTHLWRRGGVEDQLCGCREPFSRCGFWTEVIREAFGGPDSVDFRAMARLRDRVCALPRLLQVAVPALRTPGFARDVERYAEVLEAIYRAILKASGAAVVVDSSKYPLEAYLLREMDAVDLTVLHIIRDPNAVAYSWQKRKVLPEVHWEERYYSRYSFVTSALAWSLFNALLGRFEGRGVPYERVRYEDLVRDPAAVLSRAAGRIGLSEPDLGFVSPSEVTLTPNHTVSGNASRFRHGVVPLEPDLEWKEEVPGLQRALVSLLTVPGRWRYGYG